MKNIFLIFLILVSQQAYSSTGYKEAYKDIGDSPGFLKSTSCFKYYYLTDSRSNAAKAKRTSEYVAKKYLASKEYSNTDIEIAVFIEYVAINSQISEIMMGLSYGEARAKRRIRIFKKTCLRKI